MTTPPRIGLTGGIASGKSTVANLFADLGAAIIDTDVIAREVVEPGQPALAEIARQFGDDILDDRGALKRDALRQIIFADAGSRTRLEQILHPRIQEETIRQADEAGGPYQLIVVPLLVGSALMEFVDRVLVVDCSEQTQLQRLMARDGESEETARAILAAQASREERLAIADDVIHNDQSVANTRHQVEALDEIYRALA